MVIWLDIRFFRDKIHISAKFPAKEEPLLERAPTERLQQLLDEILNYHCPRYDQLPAIPLYSEQVIDLLNTYTAPFLPADSESAITPTMINNYVKQRLLPPPVKKRYEQEHVARLYCICILKHAFSVADIARLLNIQLQSYPFPVAYDYFCTEFEQALHAAFSTRDFSGSSRATRVTLESELVRSTALAAANQLFAAKSIQYYELIKTPIKTPAI